MDCSKMLTLMIWWGGAFLLILRIDLPPKDYWSIRLLGIIVGSISIQFRRLRRMRVGNRSKSATPITENKCLYKTTTTELHDSRITKIEDCKLQRLQSCQLRGRSWGVEVSNRTCFFWSLHVFPCCFNVFWLCSNAF